MQNDIIIYLQVALMPLIITNILHMVAVKLHFFKFLNIPINTKAFGENKTWRGVIFVSLVNTIFTISADYLFDVNIEHPVLLGFLLGLAYVISELPNSFIKRKKKIPAGGQHNKNKIIFVLFDKTDSAFGVSLVYYLLGYASIKIAIIIFLINIFFHIAFSLILVKTGIKKSF